MRPLSIALMAFMTLTLFSGILLGLRIPVLLPSLCRCQAKIKAKLLHQAFIYIHTMFGVIALILTIIHINDHNGFTNISKKDLLNAGYWGFLAQIGLSVTGVMLLIILLPCRRCCKCCYRPLSYKINFRIHAILSLIMAFSIYYFHVLEHQLPRPPKKSQM
ncbi:hypothetical protein GMRT_14492 [Giardia muris]|uniref:Cytochrome b561 domain-containing protein n=1 Tax=Giardia muris TaxID=5742 RepID=A0A4Z1T9T4_GIAMU|nr:hypothetical protein GMRT_14492 [Giardia muris]|eukprot:TNJ29269.1 hypothetical protein GMRT_14492 [Giardia muris]